MECHYCKGQLKSGATTYSLNRSGYHLLIDNVPAWICGQCGEPFFLEESVSLIQEMIRDVDAKASRIQKVAV